MLSYIAHQHHKTSTLAEGISKSTSHFLSKTSPNLRTINQQWLPLAYPVLQLVGFTTMMPELHTQVTELL